MRYAENTLALKDGTPVTLRPLRREDEAALLLFFRGLPDETVHIARYDVRDAALIRRWVETLDYETVFPLLAFVGGAIAADATLHRIPYGWKRHVAEVRMLLDPRYANRGLATALLNELAAYAAEFGLEKLYAEVPLEATAAIRAFRNAGFAAKAVIEGLTKDPAGNDVDILIMTCDVPADAGGRRAP